MNDLLEELYQIMIDFREAIRLGDQMSLNTSAKLLQEVMQKVYIYGERHFSTPEAEISKYITNEYNKFTDSYNRFSSFRGRKRMSDKAQQYARIAEKQFNDLLKFIIEQISDVSHD